MSADGELGGRARGAMIRQRLREIEVFAGFGDEALARLAAWRVRLVSPPRRSRP